ncbi:hypothetical protein Q3G72_029984 [Acer saccharum]|nr:hypothetical protein Q3G72_029984 [Acer saccharum]
MPIKIDEVIRRTVYLSDIDQWNSLQGSFLLVDSSLVKKVQGLLCLWAGTMHGCYPVRVLPSKTAIAPVNPTFLPRSEDEREMCSRTIYCTNIDKKVTQADLKLFFESFCGEVQLLRLLGDYRHSTRIAFVELSIV